MSCANFFSDYLSKCPDGIILNVVFDTTPYTVYLWVIEDKFGNKYQGDLELQEDGSYLIPIADLPEGMLTPYAGEFSLQIIEEAGCKPVQFLVAKYYEEIRFDVKGGDFEKQNLGCPLS